ncbi:MAG: hypothetical protein JWN96_402 [Mycobacterium sp.]|jgi:hypothetical protein|nr:hypothetical protein [Mycobacterium sp.]
MISADYAGVSHLPVARHTSTPVTIGLVVLGAVFVVIAVIYFTSSADGLPAFFPGHKAGATQHHTKHGLAALIVGLLCWIGAWMSRGRRATAVS